MLSLSQLKKLHLDGMEYARKNTGWFFPPIDEVQQLQDSLIQNASTLNEFMSAVNLSNPVFGAAFDVPEPLCCDCLLKTTLPQYGQGSLGWFFFVGNFYLQGTPAAYNFTFVRCEIAPPATVKIDRNEAVRWFVCGGYGTSAQDWVVLPYDFIYMKYNQTSYSTFALVGGGGEYISSCSFSSNQPLTFVFTLDFKDVSGVSHSMNATHVTRTPPMQNGKGANVKFGLPGLASMYWSYTDMDIVCVLDGKTYNDGKGWMDHQTFKLQGVTGISQVLYTVIKTLSGNKPINWTWMCIQDEQDGIQYMISAPLPKGYNDTPSTFREGVYITGLSCNVYHKAIPSINVTTPIKPTLQITGVQESNGHPYPTEYKIVLPSGKTVISKAVYGLNLFRNAGGQVSCESPGVLFDSKGNAIGYSVLEINGPLSNEEVAINQLIASGGSKTDLSALKTISRAQNNEQPIFRIMVAFLIFLLPFFYIILCLIVIFRHKQGKDHRFKVMIKITLFILLSIALLHVSMMRKASFT